MHRNYTQFNIGRQARKYLTPLAAAAVYAHTTPIDFRGNRIEYVCERVFCAEAKRKTSQINETKATQRPATDCAPLANGHIRPHARRTKTKQSRF